ncbi:hypothetical protein QBC32DRAFT_376330 [Pseudoneurospora amorphoporcata]|uniref:Complex 1 LYR protein domain-containing protein n=1 Tax=Pseudoneurospora amorphoporcata TaxID=241081 RepID=A0AAN6SE81_9PEZI|nr:hypothetical protein QBC32DRAFT_376330 [Pseudoneurospora amorphoporcata]
MARLSGLQKEVLGLYRKCLRECRKKPEATRAHFKAFARTEFEKNIKVDKRDFSAIEFLLRKGSRQLEVPSVARRAAEQVFRKPLSLSLQKLRRAQATRHATKVRVSFVHSNGSRNRLQQKPSPPKRGNGGAIPVIWQDIDYKGRGGPRRPMKKNRCSQEDHCCLGSPSKKDAEKPPGPYWGELPRSPVKSPPKVHNPPGQEPSIYISRDRRSVIKLRPLPPPPPGPSAPMPRPRPSPATPTPRGKAMARPSSPVRSGALHNTETWVPPETWGYTNRQLKPTKKGSRGKDRAHASSSNNRHIVSRFCNRRKALNRPIELEEAPPAIGETHESIRTVKELLPYQDQFRAAGLAVTSKEQKAYHRRGKLAPLLGKMPPAIEWLRLDGGTETHEMVIEDKKDDSPSPINVEQISQKSGEDKLYSASNGLPSPDRQSNQTVSDEEKENIQPPPVPKLQGGIPDLDKTLPALPRVFSQVLVRHGSGPSRNSSWSAAMRQFPPPIVEQKELEGSPPDKQQQQQQHKKRHQQDTTTTPSIKSATTSYGTAVIQPAKRYGQLQIQNTKQDSVITTKTPPHPSVVSSSIIELPMSKSVRSGRTIRTGTPSSSSLEKALDEAVRRLQAMGETVVVATPSTAKSKKSSSPKSKSKATTGKGKHQRWTTSSSKTVPSPTQRLQMAKALRRDKMGSGATVAAVGDGGCSPRSKPTSPASTCTVKREEDIGSSPTNTVERAEKGSSVKGTTTASQTGVPVGVGFY